MRAWDVVEILRKRRATVHSIEVSVEGDQAAEPPWPYTRIALHFRIQCERLTFPVIARVIRLSIVRYCSVINTIAAAANIEATVEVVAMDGTRLAASTSSSRCPQSRAAKAALRNQISRPSGCRSRPSTKTRRSADSAMDVRRPKSAELSSVHSSGTIFQRGSSSTE